MIHFALPWLLLLLPLPLLLYAYLPHAEKSAASSSALKLPFFKSLSAYQTTFTRSQFNQWLLLLLAFMIWALYLLAASGPQWLGNPIELPQTGRNIMLAVDISGSMQIPDMRVGHESVDRLTVVKAAANQFIQTRDNDRLGLILFGSRAYLQTPLTFDRKTVAEMLDDAEVGLAGTETAIGDAIGLGIKRLQHMPGTAKILILLTDGENNAGSVDPLEAAKVAKEQKIKIYTIGLGATQVAPADLLDAMDMHKAPGLDEKSLTEIAKLTGGEFFRAEDSNDLRRVYTALNRLEPVATSNNSFRPITPLYPWPLGLALLLTVTLACRRLLKTFAITAVK